jgi:MFS superfamily sulfate permease-like transporter
MSILDSNKTPKTGFAGLAQNWQSDLIAAFSVSLVALPLSLGIAIAAGLPPMSGIISAVIGGVIATFLRGSHVAINGPSAGLIAVILASAVAMEDGTGNTMNYIFAAIVVSGAIQVLLGFLRLGRFADLFHSTVVHGLLAAIGIIIFAKQMHVALGTESSSPEIIETLIQGFQKIPEANPFVVVISLVGLILLIFQSKINYKLFHFIPAPVWVLALSIPFVYLFDFMHDHEVSFFGRMYELGPHLLISLPDDLLKPIGTPNFSILERGAFWTSVMSITLISSIDSLAGSKAVDKMDPYRRKTNLDKDLMGMGISTMLSGLAGGLPVITVIVRSTVNLNNHAKTKWSNFFTGIFLLVFILLLSPLIQKVPLAALAILLVYTGFKMASPKVFALVHSQGIEQLIIFSGTILITLYTNLLLGLVGGLLLTLIIHYLLAQMSISDFYKSTFKGEPSLILHKDQSFEMRLKGVVNFLSSLKISALLKEIPSVSSLKVNMTDSRLVDFSIMELLYDFKRQHRGTGGKVELVGLENHISSSPDKLAMQFRIERHKSSTVRQLSLMEMGIEHGWDIDLKADDQVADLEQFYFFFNKRILKRWNRISSLKDGVLWEMCDISFLEGAMEAEEKFKSTVGLIHCARNLPKFTIEKKEFFDRYAIKHRDIDYVIYNEFSADYLVKVEDKEGMKNFLTEEIKALLEKSGLHHLECDGTGILVFSEGFNLAQVGEYSELVQFLEKMRDLMRKNSEVV